MGTFLPFWFQKGIKFWKFVDATNIFEKYEPSAFQNRSDHSSGTSGYDSMTCWSSGNMASKKGGGD